MASTSTSTKRRKVGNGPQGTQMRASGKDGPQVIRSTGKSWTDEAETVFLDHLAATCNVSASAEAAGFSRFELYKRRRRDPALAKRWRAALEQGYERIETLLMQRAVEALEGFEPNPDIPIATMNVQDAMTLIKHYRGAIAGGPHNRREWARPRSLDEMRDSILTKLEAIEAARRAETPGEDAGDGQA